MFLFILIFIFSSIFTENNIFFKIKKIYNEEDISFFLIDNDIQTELKFGTPAQKVPIFIVFNEYLSVIANKSIGGKYNSIDSKTYINTTSVDNFYFLNRGRSFYGKSSNDNIHFNIKNNYIESNKISTKIFNYSFILCKKKKKKKKKKKNMIGIQYRQFYSEREQNFINQLKENNIIKTFTYFINFPDSEIIFDVQNYGDFNYINYQLDNFKINIEFDKIEFNNETDYSNEVEIDFDFNGITSTLNYLNYINKTFFEKYYNINICYDIQITYKDIYFVTACDKSKFNYKDFPSIFFYHKKLNKTFELNKDDLFIEKNNTIYFLVYYHKIMFPEWILGYPFLKKYRFVFDPEKKIIGIPNRNFIIKTKNLNKNQIIIIFLSLIIIFMLLIFIKFCLILKNKLNRKIRANELEENYEYLSNENSNSEYKKI